MRHQLINYEQPGADTKRQLRLTRFLPLYLHCTSIPSHLKGWRRLSRAGPRSNLTFQCGFALISSIMSFFDVVLYKILRGHTFASSGLHRAPTKESCSGVWHRLQTVEGCEASQSADSPADSPAALLPQIPSISQGPPSSRVFLVSGLLPWKPITSF